MSIGTSSIQGGTTGEKESSHHVVSAREMTLGDLKQPPSWGANAGPATQTLAPMTAEGPGNGVVSVFTSTVPSTLGKSFRLSASGLVQTTSAHMSRGRVERQEFSGVHSLIELLQGISVSQAISSSVPTNGVTAAAIVTKAELSENPGAIARSTKYFEHPSGQRGLLILDYDPEETVLSQEQLLGALKDICPAIAESGVVWWCSGSSLVYNKDEVVQGLRGQRLYLLVQDIADTVRAGDILCKRLWLAGHGRVKVSNSGQLLLRSLVDLAMFQTARLDFSGGAVCELPLVQRRGSPLSMCGTGWLDTTVALPDLSQDECGRYEEMVRHAKAEVSDAVARAQERWKAARSEDAISKLVAKGVEADVAASCVEKTLSRALDGEFHGDFLVPLPDGKFVSVTEILSDLEHWDGRLTLDPLEPEYGGGRTVGKLLLARATPCLSSFAHGGKTYALRKQPSRLLVAQGRHAALAADVARKLGSEPDVFVRGDELVQIARDGLMPLDKHSLRMLVSQRFDLYAIGKEKGEIPADFPIGAADMIMATVKQFKFNRLDAVLTLPCATADGTVLTKSGYDKRYCVYLKLDDEPIAENGTPPSRESLIDALRVLWKPWSLFKFASVEDRAGMLAAILTALSRPVLQKSPGFLFDAAMPSSGKTIAARALNTLITGRHGAGVVAFQNDRNFDVELNKVFVTLSVYGGSVFQLDNVDGFLQSPTLAAQLTSGHVSGRLLGGNTWHEGSLRPFITLTSNNCALHKDLSRRFVRVRIDPGVEIPQARLFPFLPENLARQSRFDIAAAGITLMRGFIAAGMPQTATDDAGYEEWTRLIRNAVLWIHDQGLDVAAGLGEVGDPAHALLAPAPSEDPRVAAEKILLRGLAMHFGNRAFQARELADICGKPQDQLDETKQLIRAGLIEMLPGRQEITAIGAGRLLSRMRDQIIDGERLVKLKEDRSGVQIFRVEKVNFH